MIRWFLSVVITGLVSTAITSQVWACGLDKAQTKTLTNDVHVKYKSHPADIPLNDFFSLEIMFCRSNQPEPIEQLKTNISMPLHRHGMNYIANIERINNHHFIIKNLLFHMPGDWKIEIKTVTNNTDYQLNINYAL